MIKQEIFFIRKKYARLSAVDSVHISCLLLGADHCILYITLTAIKFYFIIKSLFSIRFFKTLAPQHRAL